MSLSSSCLVLRLSLASMITLIDLPPCMEAVFGDIEVIVGHFETNPLEHDVSDAHCIVGMQIPHNGNEIQSVHGAALDKAEQP